MNLQENISRIKSMMGVIKELSETTDDVVGKEFWFEYHCFESPKSCDAELWYRTHNKVLVLSIVELGCGDTKLERLLEGCPRVYRVVFEDGFEYAVFEDELMESKEEFERPDAPKRNQQESIRRILKEERNISNFLRRRLDMLDYEVERGLNGPFGGANICIFFKSEEDFFESVMENAIDAMYYNYFSHIDDNSGEWANEYLDMVYYIRNKYKDKIMKHYDDNCGSGSIPLQESIRRILREELNEVRVPRSERVELYKDDNIIVVVPLTHRALQKYAHQCQWCINDDKGEWEDYHKGLHAVIIQRNSKKPKVGITGHPTASEIFLLAKWDNNQSSFEDICQMLEYEFRNDRTMSDYYVTISNDINNFATNIVYYSPETGIYDQEDNFLWNFNIEINDIPNVKPKVIEIIDDYLTEEE